MQDHEAIQTLLDARGLAYESLARAFAEEPNGDVALLFASEDFAKTCSVLDDGKGALPAALADVAAAARRQGAQACKAEYGRWFVAQEADVYPWESVHVTGERVLFQRCTLEVREAYRAQGFQAAGYPHEPDDHLATELHFMGRLASRAARECEAGEARACAEALVASLGFLKDHLGKWAGSFADSFDDALAKDGRAGEGRAFYAACARLVERLVASDARLLEEVAFAVAA